MLTILRYDDANEMLINEFEETRKVFNANEALFGVGFNSGTQHCFYEEALVPYVVKLLNENRNDDLKKVLVFVEKMFTDGDEDVVDMAETSVVEPIYYELDYEKHRDLILSLCGTKTRKSFEDMDEDEPEGV